MSSSSAVMRPSSDKYSGAFWERLCQASDSSPSSSLPISSTALNPWSVHSRRRLSRFTTAKNSHRGRTRRTCNSQFDVVRRGSEDAPRGCESGRMGFGGQHCRRHGRRPFLADFGPRCLYFLLNHRHA